MALDGDIARRARAELPLTWDMLAQATEYGEAFLQDHIDDVKYALFATVVDTAEESAYNRRLLRYAGKTVALRVIPGGIDWWGDQPTARTANDEREQYPDRQSALFKLYANLAKELQEQWPSIDVLLPSTTPTRRIWAPDSDAPAAFQTPAPWLFPNQQAGGAGATGTTGA